MEAPECLWVSDSGSFDRKKPGLWIQKRNEFRHIADFRDDECKKEFVRVMRERYLMRGEEEH